MAIKIIVDKLFGKFNFFRFAIDNIVPDLFINFLKTIYHEKINDQHCLRGIVMPDRSGVINRLQVLCKT